MDARLLAAAGIDPSLPAAQAAATLVRRLPLRWHAAVGTRDAESVVESRWFAGAAECHRVLARLFRGSPVRGRAFSSTWPLLEAAGMVVAPALPVAATTDEQPGPDAVYQLEGGTVWREAAGERRAMLASGSAAAPDVHPFELLWFGGGERFLLHAGTLEVEDLFSVTRVRAARELVERLVVRGLRVDPEVLEGMAWSGREAAAEIEVRRPAELVPGDVWRDPAAVLAARADIRSVARRGDELTAETARGTTVVFRVAEDRRGWRIFTWEGDYPLRTLGLLERAGHLVLSATLGPELDALAPEVRSRLVFDLRSDLIALGKAKKAR
jgi:hypothetical protein